jgi:ribosomal protein S5
MELFVSTYIGIGFSKDPDTVKAAQEAAQQAKNNLHSSNIDLAIVLNTCPLQSSEVLFPSFTIS